VGLAWGRRVHEAVPRKLKMHNGNCSERLPNTKLLKFVGHGKKIWSRAATKLPKLENLGITKSQSSRW
jgi:hypothetical protein